MERRRVRVSPVRARTFSSGLLRLRHNSLLESFGFGQRDARLGLQGLQGVLRVVVPRARGHHGCRRRTGAGTGGNFDT